VKWSRYIKSPTTVPTGCQTKIGLHLPLTILNLRQGSHNPQVPHRVWLGSDSLSNPREARTPETIRIFYIFVNTPELPRNPPRPALIFVSERIPLNSWQNTRNHNLFSVTCFPFRSRFRVPAVKRWAGIGEEAVEAAGRIHYPGMLCTRKEEENLVLQCPTARGTESYTYIN
jgi:hypothetical protein